MLYLTENDLSWTPRVAATEVGYPATFNTAPMQEPLELTGPVALRLWALVRPENLPADPDSVVVLGIGAAINAWHAAVHRRGGAGGGDCGGAGAPGGRTHPVIGAVEVGCPCPAGESRQFSRVKLPGLPGPRFAGPSTGEP